MEKRGSYKNELAYFETDTLSVVHILILYVKGIHSTVISVQYILYRGTGAY
jgi:hypothetical protein